VSGARVLVVDDDPGIVRAVRRALDARGYATAAAADAAAVPAALRDHRPDLILLDLVLPDGDGIDVCRAIRATSDVPIIVLSAVGDDRRKVAALDEGADDYLVKPFSMDELLARVRVALRRRAGLSRNTLLVARPLALDLERHSVTVDGTPVHLTPTEYELLRELAQAQGRLLTQRTLLARVWGAEYVDDAHILRTFIHQLRTKLGAVSPGAAAMIVNDPGVGYRLVAPQS
jgi:two-component system KDP operon response regulator KdpE